MEFESYTKKDPSNKIHPTAWIEPGTIIGHDNYIGPFTYIASNVKIGNRNRFEGHCSIGTPPEFREHHLSEKNKGVIILHDTVIKEFVTINRGTTRDTFIGNRVWMLRGSHAGHDSILCDDSNISCSVLVGGHSVVMPFANLGLGAIIHQKRVIGSHCMIGMNSTVTKDIPPFMTAFGSPCKPRHLNEHGLKINAPEYLKDLLQTGYEELFLLEDAEKITSESFSGLGYIADEISTWYDWQKVIRC